MPTIAPGGIQIEAPGGTAIVVTPGYWEHYKLRFLHVDLRHVRVTEGLMGRVAPGDWLPALPTGEMLGPARRLGKALSKSIREVRQRLASQARELAVSTTVSGMSTASYTIAGRPVLRRQITFRLRVRAEPA